MAKGIFDVIQEMQAGGNAFAVATVVETVGSVSAKTASKAVIDHQGRVLAGWVGGGCAESTTCSKALECMESGETAVKSRVKGGTLRTGTLSHINELASWHLGSF